MKKLILTLTTTLACVGAFAQGKVTFGNDSQRYFVLGNTLSADAALGGGVTSTAGNTASGSKGAIPVSPLPSGVTLAVQLYAGTASGAETLQTTISLTGANWLSAGRMANKSMTLTGVPGGQSQFFRIDVFDGAFANATLAGAAGSYAGTSGEFRATPGSSITFPFINSAAAGSTWPFENLVINAVPEPGSFALAGLGAAALFIFRRRK